jgi:hypothetical protein
MGEFKWMDSERAESYLREYNDYVLQILNIHEAIPGHYTQLVYSNHLVLLRLFFGNGAMIEDGPYILKNDVESGYKKLTEMWLMYYKWNLRTMNFKITVFTLKHE